jgi:hypothetical protein
MPRRKFRWPVVNLDLTQRGQRWKFSLGCLGIIIMGAALAIGAVGDRSY